MTDPKTTPIVVPISPLAQQLKAQVRIGLAAIGGALVLRHVLPVWAVNDQTIDYITGIVMLGGAAVWSWLRAKASHLKLFTIAEDSRVPDSVAVVR